MTALLDRVKAMIATDGPMPVSVYMTLCLHDPEHGYYATRPGVGTDFRTAPETSQAFGELLGLWCVHEWRTLGRPSALSLCELGPGRGTLMADALKATRSQSGFGAAVHLHLVEASPALRTVQAERLGDADPQFLDGLEALPDGPALILGNEFLDCLPARQFVRGADGAWHERVVGRSETGQLAFGLAADTAPDVPARVQDAVEVQPGLETVVQTLAARTAPFRALFIDYGPSATSPGDTLRAFRAGEQVDPLSAPGEADLTVDVDFGRLARLAEAAGLTVHGPIPQGQFLMALGLQARLDQLVVAHPEQGPQLFAAAQSLVDPAEMGTRFQVICLSGGGDQRVPLPPPAGF